MISKFRVWNMKEKRMLYDSDYYYINGLGKIIRWDNTKKAKVVNIIMPLFSTGLKDKNSKEIFEGDILKSVSRWHWEDRKFVVELKDGCFFPFGLVEESCEGQEFVDNYNVEVIGNIYENPELLKVK